MALLTLRGVAKGYRTARRSLDVLSAIDLEVHEGECVVLIGASGSGKTTLISLIAGLERPDAGTIEFDGHAVDSPAPERGVVFQSYALMPWLTVFENVALAVDAVQPDRSADWRRQHAEHFIRLVGLGDAMEKRPAALSGGMRQRVAVARGLAMEPRLLLLDEPFSALDALTRAGLQQELSKILATERRTALLVTNDVDEAIVLGDRVHVLTQGSPATLGPRVQVDLLRPRSRRLLARAPEYVRLRGAIVDSLAVGRERLVS